jgi:hypothetical protein
MGLVSVFFGTECDYYKGLQQVYKMLELKEVVAQKARFTPETCRQITWAILDNGRAFFNDVKTNINLQGPNQVAFLQSYLIDILHDAQYALLVYWSNFPEQWLRRERQRDNLGGRSATGARAGTQGGDASLAKGSYTNSGGGSQKREYRWGSSPYSRPGGYGGSGGYGGPGGGQTGGHGQYGQFSSEYLGTLVYLGTGSPTTRNRQSGWMVNRHPKIKELMNPYLEKLNGRLHLAELLDAAGKQQSDLPKLPKFTHPNGQPFLCCNSTLGRCMYRECKYMHAGSHPKPGNIPDSFVDQCIDVLGKGIVAWLQGGLDDLLDKKPKTSKTINLA